MLLQPGGSPCHRGHLLSAGRGRRPEPQHKRVQPGSVLLASLKRIPERSSLCHSWKYEILISDEDNHLST